MEDARGKFIAISLIARGASGFAVRILVFLGGRPDKRFEITELTTQVTQHASDGVGIIITAALAMVNAVATTAVGVSLEQTKLAQETLVIGNDTRAASTTAHTPVNLTLRQLALDVANPTFAPRSSDPFLGEIVPVTLSIDIL